MPWILLLATPAWSDPAARPFVAPPPRVLGPATPPTESCVDGPQASAYEHRRELAALDAALRAEGGLLLEVMAVDGECRSCAPGSTMRGPSGEHWMVLAVGEACGIDLMTVALDAEHAVFTVSPWVEPARVRHVRECYAIWTGCGGAPGPDRTLVVEVPVDAHLAAPRLVRFPIDVGVAVDPPLDRDGNPIRAQPPP